MGKSAHSQATTRDPYLDQIRDILCRSLQEYRVKMYLFGSRARGTASTGSDCDIGIDSLEDLPKGLLSIIREELEESFVPYQVELIDLRRTTSDFAEKVRREGVVWNDCDSE